MGACLLSLVDNLVLRAVFTGDPKHHAERLAARVLLVQVALVSYEKPHSARRAATRHPSHVECPLRRIASPLHECVVVAVQGSGPREGNGPVVIYEAAYRVKEFST